MPAFMVCLSTTLSAQWIVAGETRPTDHYHDLLPDTLLNAPQGLSGGSESLFLDLNVDGTMDLELKAECQLGGMVFTYHDGTATPLNGTQLSWARMDSCFANMPDTVLVFALPVAATFHAGDTIDADGGWTEQPVTLGYHSSNASVPNNFGYGCSASDLHHDPGFLGVRLVSSGDTLYGWVHLPWVGLKGDSLLVSEFAFQLQPVGIAPAAVHSDQLIVRGGWLEIPPSIPGPVRMLLMDATGRVVMARTVHAGLQDLGSLVDPAGMYVCVLHWTGGSWSTRLILEQH
ncbi:MAG: hypothetical protein KDC02_24680 [Flavobacteriales bacterium]|nr:hypothetical protein [Flavobacteriales bacterium]